MGKDFCLGWTFGEPIICHWVFLAIRRTQKNGGGWNLGSRGNLVNVEIKNHKEKPMWRRKGTGPLSLSFCCFKERSSGQNSEKKREEVAVKCGQIFAWQGLLIKLWPRKYGDTERHWSQGKAWVKPALEPLTSLWQQANGHCFSFRFRNDWGSYSLGNQIGSIAITNVTDSWRRPTY